MQGSDEQVSLRLRANGMSRIRNIGRNIKKWISILCIRGKNLEGLSRVQIDDRIVYIYLERK